MSDNYQNYVTSLTPAGWWQCQDASGAGHLADSSGNGITLATLTHVTLAQAGIIPGVPAETSASFASGKAITSATPSGINGLSAFTLLAWVLQPANQTGLAHVFQTVASVGNPWGLTMGPSGLSFLCPDGNTYSTGIDAVGPGQLYMVSARNSNPFVSVDVNGLSEASSLGGANTGGQLSLAIGAATAGDLSGSVQQAAIFPSYLTDAQLKNLYYVGISGNPISGGVPNPPVGQPNAPVFSWSTVVLPANPARTRVTLTNDSGAPVWVTLGPTAVAGQGKPLLANGGPWTPPHYCGPISAINGLSALYGNLCIMEETG